MNRSSRLSVCCLTFIAGTFVAGVLTAAPPAPPATKVGFAERDVTPDIGMEQPGGYGKSFHRVLHDHCKARAVVFDDGKKRVALVGVDALLVRRETVQIIRQEIEKKCGIPAEAILIGASHSHSSGPTGMILPGEFEGASPLVKILAYDKSSTADAKYLDTFIKQTVDAVCAADAARKPARCGIGSGIEDKVAFNRRFRMRSGLTFTHPGQGNPDIIESAGPVDPQVGVIGAWDDKGKFLGCVVNFACHATTNPGGISANYVYYVEKAVRGIMGEDAVVVFLNGASGDITQVNNLSPHAYPGPERWAHLVGGRVGAEAGKVLLSMEPGDLLPIDYRLTVFQSPRRIPKPERVKKCVELVQKDIKTVDATEWTFAKEIVLLDALIAKSPTVEVEVQTVQIGPAVFITDPAEFFVEFGLELKAKSGFPFTFPVSLANGCVGYVPTPEALGPRGGGYETRLTSYSNLEPNAGTKMVEAGIKLAHELKPGPVPIPAPAPPFKNQPWTYGKLPPELD